MTDREKEIRGHSIQNLMAHKGWKYIVEDMEQLRNHALALMVNGEFGNDTLENRGKVKMLDRYIGKNNILNKWINDMEKILQSRDTLQ